MFSAIRSRLRPSPAGAVAVIALVFAMVGGSYAASKTNQQDKDSTQAQSSGLTKKQVLALIKANTVPGPQGLQGLPGANGNDGAAGKDGVLGGDGKDGATGPPGTGVTTIDLEDGEGGCVAGGLEIYSESGADVVCNGLIGKDGKDGKEGEDGEPWTPEGTLPPNATETGVFALTVKGEAQAPIPFTVPLAEALPPEKVHIAPDPSCPGAVAEPTALSGHLCVYVKENWGEVFVGGPYSINESLFESVFAEHTGAGKAGAFLFLAGEESNVWGSWAVTG